jgi:hypothetical protein
MYKRHLDQQRSNQCSTWDLSSADSSDQQPDVETRKELEYARDKLDDAREDACPYEPPMARSHYMYVEWHATTGTIYTDPTGKIFQPSTSGNSYILVVYDYDGNYVDAIPMPKRKGPYIVIAYKKAHKFLEYRGFKPLLQRLENEAYVPFQNQGYHKNPKSDVVCIH